MNTPLSILASILASPAVGSAARRVVTIAASSFATWAITKGYMSGEMSVALGALVGAFLEAWAAADRKRVESRGARKGAAAVADAVLPERGLGSDVGMCDECGEEAVLGVGDEVCRACAKRRRLTQAHHVEGVVAPTPDPTPDPTPSEDRPF